MVLWKWFVEFLCSSIFLFHLIFLKVQLEVECRFVQDQLKGDLATELKVKFLKKLEDALPIGED